MKAEEIIFFTQEKFEEGLRGRVVCFLCLPGDSASVGGQQSAQAQLQAAQGGYTIERERVVTMASLRAVTVEAMSNLLSANIDAGLIHSIGEF